MQRKRVRIAFGIAVVFMSWLVVGVSPAGAANLHSPVEAGYKGSAADPFTKAAARITVPTVTCPASGFYNGTISAQWSASGGAVAQLSVNINCNNGTLGLFAGISELDPTGNGFRTLNVAAGDVLQGNLSYAPVTGAIKVTGKNITTGQTTSESATRKGLAWFGAAYTLSRTNGVGPTGATTTAVTPELFEFTPIVFGSLTIDGASAVSKLSAGLTGYDMYNNANTHKLATATAFNVAGNSFRVRFVAAS
jgi:hypothetical protein